MCPPKKTLKRASVRGSASITARTTIVGNSKVVLTEVLLVAFLIVATMIAFRQVLIADFVYDDEACVLQNTHITNGLNWSDFKWALTTIHVGLWTPMVWLSYMLDYRVAGFDFDPRIFHLTNLLIHVATTLLIYLLFRGTTGMPWRSAFVAGLFALHPIHVESVAWVTERKDVLCAFFWIVTLLAYSFYVKRPSIIRYILVILPFIMGLMSKPMIATLPFTLLLMDYWPLKRLQFRQEATQSKVLRPVIFLEKLPFFVMCILPSVLAYVGQREYGSLIHIPLGECVKTAIVSYVGYLVKTVWPVGLAVHYPHPGTFPAFRVVISTLALVVFSIIAAILGRRYRYLIMGWLWYIITLAPVSGIVVYGVRSLMPDRYTYIPLLGIFIIVTWGLSELVSQIYRTPWPSRILGILGSLIIICFVILTDMQVAYWRNSTALWKRAIEVTHRNALAHYNLGVALEDKGHSDEALENYRRAVEISPTYADARLNLGAMLGQQGKFDEALEHLAVAKKFAPQNANAYLNIGNILAIRGRNKEAIEQYEQVLKINPQISEAHNNLGNVLLAQGKNKEAAKHYAAAIRISPHDSLVHANLATALCRMGRYEEAWQHVRLSQKYGGNPPQDLIQTLSRHSPPAPHSNLNLKSTQYRE